MKKNLVEDRAVFARDWISASEVLTWIAFRKPQNYERVKQKFAKLKPRGRDRLGRALDTAADELVSEVVAGNIVAVGTRDLAPGVPDPTAAPVSIPEDIFALFVTITWRNQIEGREGGSIDEFMQSRTRPLYRDLRFRARQILACWPETKNAPRPRSPLRQDFDSWYRERVADWPKDKRSPSRRQDWIDGHEAGFRDVTQKRVYEVRAKYAPESWTREGRRPPQSLKPS